VRADLSGPGGEVALIGDRVLVAVGAGAARDVLGVGDTVAVAVLGLDYGLDMRETEEEKTPTDSKIATLFHGDHASFR